MGNYWTSQASSVHPNIPIFSVKRWNFYHKAFSVFKTDSYLSKTGEGTKLCITGGERRSRLMSHRATELDSSQAAISDIP